MNKRIKGLILLAISILMLTACAIKAEKPVENNKLQVTVTTSFLQDMVDVLAKDYVDIQLVIPAGEDPHTYEAKPEDTVKLKDADLVLYHGLHFEGKMIDFLESINGVEVTKGFEHDQLLTMEEDGDEIVDPHFWFDVDLYKMAVQNAADALIAKLPAHKDDINKNLDAYLSELDELREFSTEQIASIPKESRILITPHDAFSYFSRQYNIEVQAPQGVSTDAELSTSDMSETANFIVENKVKAIFAESTTDPKRMEKLQESCKEQGFEVTVVQGDGNELFSDSLSSKGEDADTYIKMVKHNVNLIVENLK